MSYRPHIKMRFSRWEVFLILMSIVVWIPSIVYYYNNRDNIPDIIIFKSNKPGQSPKDGYFRSGVTFTFFWSAIGIYFFKKSPRSIYPETNMISRDVSRDIFRAKQQYRVENSFWFINILILNIFYSITTIDEVNKELKHTYFMAHWWWWLVFPLAILISWLIHHILWTRLSDERSQ
jgi:hypothetical protein